MTQVILIAAFMGSVRRILNDCVRGLGSPLYGGTAEVVSVGVFLIAALVLAQWFGAIGVVWARVLGSFCGAATLALAIARMMARQARTAEQSEAALA